MNELRTGLADYLVLRRSLGYKLARSGTVLEDFVSFAEAGGWTHIHTEMALSWALRAPNAESRWRADRLAMVRGLARYLHAIDPDHEVPPTGLIPGRRRQPAPFLYSDEQVVDLMAASRRLRSPIQAATLEAVLGLLWATGLRVALTTEEITALLAAPDLTTRIGRRDRAILLVAIRTGLRVSELAGLRRADVAFGPSASVSCIGKGRKHRTTPIDASTAKVVHAWLAETVGDPAGPLFAGPRGDPLSRDAVSRIVSRHTRRPPNPVRPLALSV